MDTVQGQRLDAMVRDGGDVCMPCPHYETLSI